MALGFAQTRRTCSHFEWEEFCSHGGMFAVDIVAKLNKDYGLDMDPATVAEDKRLRYCELLKEEPLPVIPETVVWYTVCGSRGFLMPLVRAA